MKKSTISKKAMSVVFGIVFLLNSATAFAEPATGTNISSQTIPVKATIDSYYEIGMPASLDGSGTLNLTRDHNDRVSSAGDTAGTFYGFTTVSIKGTIGSSKKVHCDLTCAPLVKTLESSTTAPVGMKNLTDVQAALATAIWANTGTDSLSFGSAAWTSGATGVGIDFTNSDVNSSDYTNEYVMLRTLLPKDGTYTGNLEIDFSLVNA